MSNRTYEATKAVREAWAREKDLILEGRGTRDWTPEQQLDILDDRVPVDENGKPFEGHHMRSVEAYPEYQDDPDNIQFLTREEHQAAHEGNFQNATNSYYDPETGEFYDLGDGEELPNIERDLSDPVMTEEDDEDLEDEEDPEEDDGEDLYDGIGY